MLTIAISKGRIFGEALPLMARAGMRASDDPERSRKLVVQTDDAGVRLVVLRAQDVPTFVEHGAADFGIAGKDVLLEYEGDGLYEPLDLKIARCRMVLAAPEAVGAARPGRHARLRVATKYVRTTRRYFARHGEQVEMIPLYGSMEIAPVLGLADRIVDLVDTGNTLRANGLTVLDEIAEISSRLILNKASMKMKHAEVCGFIERMAGALENEPAP